MLPYAVYVFESYEDLFLCQQLRFKIKRHLGEG